MPGAAAALLGALSGVTVLADVSVEPLLYGRAEVAAGYAPIGLNQEREPSMSSEVEPGAGLSIQGERSSLELTLSPRLYYRLPNFDGVGRPLILVKSAARHSFRMTPRLTWSSDLAVQVGEVEYSSTRLVTDSPIAQPEDASVLSTFDVNASTGLAWAVTPTYTSSLRVVAEHNEPLGSSRDTTPFTTGGGADAAQRFFLDDRSSLAVTTSYHYYSISTEPDWMSVPVSLDYLRSLSRGTTLGAGIGATAAFQAEDPVQVFPTATFTVERVLHETRVAKVSNRFGTSMTATFDTVIGRLYPVAGIEASLAGMFGDDWTAGIGGFAYTAATREPIYEDGRDTYISFEGRAAYRLSREWSLDFGARETARGTHLSIQPFEFSQGETWGFVGISYVLGGTGGGGTGGGSTGGGGT
jgi:hypothetical protein